MAVDTLPDVAIVGDRDSGKTTFLALLYAAQVKSGSAKEDDFRFHVTFESIDEIGGLYEQLMSGSFPDAASKEGIREISFHLGYQRPGLGILSRLRSQGQTPGGFSPFRFIVMRNLEDEMSRFRAGSSVAGGRLMDVLGCDAIAILVDSKGLAVSDEDLALGAMGKYDATVESLLTAIERSREHGARRLLHPIFIFTKFDSVEPEALRVANVDGAPPGVTKTGPRTAYAQALLKHNLPRTLAKVSPRKLRGLDLTKPSYFFSWVHTEGTGPGRGERVRLRQGGAGGWEPEYSKDEYLAFLERLWSIAASTDR